MDSTQSSFDSYPDLLGLASASMTEMVDELIASIDAGPPPRGVPRATHQIAKLTRSETIRLIRLGTPRENSRAALALSRVVIGRHARRLEAVDPEATRIVAASSSVLGAAAAPSSSGAALNVLGSWRGVARRVVELLQDQAEHEMERAELRERLGIKDQSHLSHVLGDLEAAGLIVRLRKRGRNVTVHLGPVARTPIVQDLLSVGTTIENDLAQRVRAALERIVAPARLGDENADVETVAHDTGLEYPLREVRRFRERVQGTRIGVEDLVVSSDAIVACLRFRGVRWGDFDRPLQVDVRQVWLVRARDELVTAALRSPSIDQLIDLGRAKPKFQAPRAAVTVPLTPGNSVPQSDFQLGSIVGELAETNLVAA